MGPVHLISDGVIGLGWIGMEDPLGEGLTGMKDE